MIGQRKKKIDQRRMTERLHRLFQEAYAWLSPENRGRIEAMEVGIEANGYAETNDDERNLIAASGAYLIAAICQTVIDPPRDGVSAGAVPVAHILRCIYTTGVLKGRAEAAQDRSERPIEDVLTDIEATHPRSRYTTQQLDPDIFVTMPEPDGMVE